MDAARLPHRLLPVGRRHIRRKLRDNIMGITRPAIRRLARRGGVVRIKKEVYDEIRVVIKTRIAEVLQQVVHIMDSASTGSYQRRTVSTRDVAYALKRMGNTLYGFD
ncbi:hypothetical protein FE257_007315 [Aspergillus nanangensis]|uniref:Histone H4 n=1 Tax=Aspergillus nanangensis TaxID=2582783 RepID=A0AAD4CMS7_ASPNN|nr:hypothetical protein FE257_007315 [Aspergillus nanangensis]